MPTKTGDTSNTKIALAGSTWKEKVATIVGAIVLVAFGLLILYLINRARPASENEWDRDVYLYGSVEAVAFAAAGFFFGTTVQRQATQHAEQQAGQAEQRAEQSEHRARQAEEEAVKGRTVATLIRAKSKGQATKQQPYGGLGRPEDVVKATMADFDELAQVVDELFPLKDKA